MCPPAAPARRRTRTGTAAARAACGVPRTPRRAAGPPPRAPASSRLSSGRATSSVTRPPPARATRSPCTKGRSYAAFTSATPGSVSSGPSSPVTYAGVNDRRSASMNTSTSPVVAASERHSASPLPATVGRSGEHLVTAHDAGAGSRGDGRRGVAGAGVEHHELVDEPAVLGCTRSDAGMDRLDDRADRRLLVASAAAPRSPGSSPWRASAAAAASPRPARCGRGTSASVSGRTRVSSQLVGGWRARRDGPRCGPVPTAPRALTKCRPSDRDPPTWLPPTRCRRSRAQARTTAHLIKRGRGTRPGEAPATNDGDRAHNARGHPVKVPTPSGPRRAEPGR